MKAAPAIVFFASFALSLAAAGPPELRVADPAPKSRKLAGPTMVSSTIYEKYTDPATGQPALQKHSSQAFVQADLQPGSMELHPTGPLPFTGQVPMNMVYNVVVHPHQVSTPLNLGAQYQVLNPINGLHSPFNLHHPWQNIYGMHPEMYMNYAPAAPYLFMNPHGLNPAFGPQMPPMGGMFNAPAYQNPGNFNLMPQGAQPMNAGPAADQFAGAGIGIQAQNAAANIQNMQLQGGFPAQPMQSPGMIQNPAMMAANPMMAPNPMMAANPMMGMDPYSSGMGFGAMNPMMRSMGSINQFSPYNAGDNSFTLQEYGNRFLKSTNEERRTAKSAALASAETVTPVEQQNSAAAEQKDNAAPAPPIKI